AISLNVTATRSTQAGFITVYACGTREFVSSVNFEAGQTVPNAVITPISPDGEVCFYSSVPVDVVVDVNGWFTANRAFTAVGPVRVFDTRPGQSPDAVRSAEVPKQRIKGGELLEVKLTDLAGYVPAAGVGAVSINVTAANPSAAGFITVYPCGTRDFVSSVNYLAAQNAPNAVITPVSATGTVCFFSTADTDLVVDINGWLKSPSGFTSVSPKRVFDTRPGQTAPVLRAVETRQVGGTYVLEVKVTDLAGVTPATGVSAVSLNVTATNPGGPGFITVDACGVRREVSSLNYATGETIANAVLAPLSPTGTICFYAQTPVDIVVDINGWFTDQPS
ncbi:MAG TPA: hypothetical protein PLV68_12000, partial [Ilumatobacteraceae bacterium]|nr:hypothetical protein [Ilumatobacteraceae bacterium]